MLSRGGEVSAFSSFVEEINSTTYILILVAKFWCHGVRHVLGLKRFRVFREVKIFTGTHSDICIMQVRDFPA